MRVFLEVLQFEFRQQLKSPFLYAVLLVFFLVHFFSITSTGINLWAHPLANINSAYAVAVTETTLSIFGMLPVIVFVAHAILRDHDSVTAALFFVKPISKQQYLWGRFSAACLLTTMVGLTGLLGSLTGTLMPWLDQERIAPFSLQPFLFSFCAIILPNMLILCALFFSVASLSRSLAATVALALIFMMGDIVLGNFVLSRGFGQGNASAWVLADHSATLVVAAATRNLTVAELNVLSPQVLLLKNRLLWLGIAFAVLLFSFRRFRFDLSRSSVNFFPFTLNPSKGSSAPRLETKNPSKGSGRTEQTMMFLWSAALASQLRKDVFCVLRSPLFLLILALGVSDAISEYSGNLGPLLNAPQYPLTSLMLGFFRFGLEQFVLIIAIYYSGMLLHRERESGVADIMGASPFPNWIMPLSKTISLCAVVTLLLVVMMLTAIALQALNGYTNFELGLYLRAVLLYNGFYFWMLCVLAVLVQAMVSNKWLGMLLLFAIYLVLLTLGAFGFEHILYGFSIPYIVYSDMNGFGHASQQIHALIGYWACFCVLLIVLGHLLYRRGLHVSFKERMRDARTRFSAPVATITVLCAVGFVAVGSWIFYNTNVLNAYETSDALLQAQASYESKYGQYENRPTPSFIDIDMAIDIFPEERRLESRGTALLRNNKRMAIEEFVVSANPRMRVNEIKIDAATLKAVDAAQGFYLFSLDTPLQPGTTTTMKWNMSRINRGFANSNHDTEVVENGTFVGTEAVMPVPGFDDSRKLTDNALRKKFGLTPAARLPALGDPKFLDNLGFGVDSRSGFRALISTAADQIAVGPGELKREWLKNGRRYFEYVAERPIWPALAFTSARFEIATDQWKDASSKEISLEVYYDPKHSYNVRAMLDTAKRSLDYFTREFSPYQYSYFRIVEYPRYRSAARAFPGIVPYSEAAGFVTNLATLRDIDYATIHELAHMWWGHQAYGAKMQGQEMLNETLAQYSTLMVFKNYGEENDDPTLINRLTREFQRGYLASRSADKGEERPLMYTEDQGYISYNKGPLAFYVLQELIGEDAVNQALRNYLAKFAFKPAPFPTSRDVVNELRAVAGADYRDLITDLFEKIVLYDVELANGSVVKVGDGYEIMLTVTARQFEANGRGTETEVPLHTWFDVALFSQTQALENQTPLYLKKHLLQSGTNAITIHVAEKPAYASVDPFQQDG